MKPNYTALFGHVIQAKDLFNVEKLTISQASCDELRKFVPMVDFSQNKDLMGIAFDVAVVNAFNRNGDGICTMGARKAMRTFIEKPINIEHDRSTIVGHIISSRFTERSFKKELSYEDVEGKTDLFNITLGGFLYRIVAKELGNLLRSIQEGKEKDFSVAASWEVGFEKYFAAVGSNVISECEIITNEEEVAKLAKYMKAFGGKGVDGNGRIINRLIDPSGEIVFLGAGLTKYPAADVKDVFVFDFSDYMDKGSDDGDDDDEEEDDEIPASCKKNISHSSKANVIEEGTDKNMDPKQLQELIKKTVTEANSEFGVEAIANVSTKIADAIIESNKTFVQEKEASEKKLSDALARETEKDNQLKALAADVAKNAEALKVANDKIAEFERVQQEALATQKFNERMSALDKDFELNDSDREVLVKQVKAIASDEDFAAYKNNLDVLLSSKLKTKIQEAKASEEAKVQGLLKEELQKRGIKDPLDGKTADGATPPNNVAEASTQEESAVAKLVKSLNKKQVKVSI